MKFICQLPKEKQFKLYKIIKRILIEEECYSYENIANAMNSKVKDITGIDTNINIEEV